MKWARKKRDNAIPRRRQRDDAVTERRQQEEKGRALFRRNRTLVGSVSPIISSASELGASLKSPRAHSHHLAAHRRYLAGLFVSFVLVAASLTWFIYEFSARVQVSSANVDSSLLKTERYTSAISDYLGSRPQERLRTLTNKEQLSEYLRQVVGEVDEVSSYGPGGFASTKFELTFRKPVASWLIGSDRYYVDKNGIPFRVNYFDEPKVNIVDDSGVPQIAGTVIASSKFLRFVGLAVDTARTFDITVKQALIPKNMTRQIQLRITKHPYPIKLSLDRPVGEQIEDMKKTVDYLSRKNIVPKYIDVRVSGRSYYKL